MVRFSGLMAATALGAACALTPMTAGAQVVTQPLTTPTIQQETTLNLNGMGEIKVAPDIAIVSLGVNVDADTAAAAMREQARLMSGVFSALKKAGIDDKDMQTGSISLNPRYDYSSRKDGQPPRLIGYNASNTVTAVIHKLDDVGKVLDATVKAGGNTINSISFGLEDSTDAMVRARKAAMKDAMDKASLYADAAGYAVSRVVTINESGGYRPQPQMMARAEMASDQMSTPIAPGEISYSAQVNVMFELTR